MEEMKENASCGLKYIGRLGTSGTVKEHMERTFRDCDQGRRRRARRERA